MTNFVLIKTFKSFYRYIWPLTDMTQINTSDAQNHLNAIAKTKLLFGTDKELYIAMGYSENTQNIGRIGGNNAFMKEAAVAWLNTKYAKTISAEIDLISLLLDYSDASEYVHKYKRQKYFKQNEDNFAALIKYFCSGLKDCKDEQLLADLREMKTNSGVQDGYVLPIMLLILWQIIPTYNTKKAADVKDIRKDAEQMFRMVELAIHKSGNILRRYPIIDRLRKELCILESPNRLWLIHSLAEILDVFYSNSSPENMMGAMEEISWNCLDIKGYWEDIEAQDGNTIWHFYSEDDSYYMVKQLMRDQRNVFYRTYDMYLIDSKYSDAVAYIAPTEALKGLILNGKISDDMQFTATIDISKTPDGQMIMELSCCSDNDWFTSRKLRKIMDKSYAEKYFERASSWIHNIDYKQIDHAYAVTADYIYFKKPGTELFYKIPRFDEFQNTDIYGLSMFQSKDYLFVGCPATLKYLDISDESNLDSKGVSIVKYIE